MAIEIILIRLFEIATLLAFFIMTLTIGAFLVLLKVGLIFFGLAFTPTVAIIVFTATQLLNIIVWSLQVSVSGFVDYGQKLID